jgi:hypothetical protein
VKDVLLWGLAGVLFVMAAASFVFSILVKEHEKRYLSWVAVALWALLCVALALVLRTRFLPASSLWLETPPPLERFS